jgi:adenosylcobinamide-GDP ribazoletransferase
LLFPVVGAGVGVLGGLTAAGLQGPLPGLVAGALGVAAAVALTGGLHVDALADTADALGTERSRALEIMRDPRIGAYGAVALAIAVLVEASSLGALAQQGDAVRGFLVAGALSRAGAPLLAQVLPYARASGTGGVLSTGLAALAPALGAALAAGLAVLCFGWTGLAVTGIVAAVAVACGLAWRAWLGGVTGDTLGASIQLTEVAALVVLLGLR